MEYEAPTRSAVRHVLTEDGDFFRLPSTGVPLLEWAHDDHGEVLMSEGTPLVRVVCHDRRWTWRALDAESAPIRAGSRAEARLLAAFYARRRSVA